MTTARVTTLTLDHTPGEVRMPLIGLGTWRLRGRTGYEAIRHALDLGYRHIDTATMYGNEIEVGRALRDSAVPREEVFLTTKLPPGRVGAVRQTLVESLHALGVEQVDLWLVHWPPHHASPQTWQKFIAAREEGLTRAIGVSNYSTREIDELTTVTGATPAVNQIEWAPSLYDPHRHTELRERGVTLEGYSPFKRTHLADPVLTDIAAAHGVSPAQVVLRWHVEHGTVAIPKSATPERLAANLDVFGFAFDADEVTRVDALGHP